jgi:hypothetical protein
MYGENEFIYLKWEQLFGVLREDNTIPRPFFVKVALAAGVIEHADLCRVFADSAHWEGSYPFRKSLGDFLGCSALALWPLSRAVALEKGTLPMLKAFLSGPEAFRAWGVDEDQYDYGDPVLGK